MLSCQERLVQEYSLFAGSGRGTVPSNAILRPLEISARGGLLREAADFGALEAEDIHGAPRSPRLPFNLSVWVYLASGKHTRRF
jgi:hypothetical protein